MQTTMAGSRIFAEMDAEDDDTEVSLAVSLLQAAAAIVVGASIMAGLVVGLVFHLSG